MEFTGNFAQNLKLFQDAFVKDDTFTVKMVRNPHLPGLPIVVLLSSAMVSNDVTDRDVILSLETASL